MIENFNPFICLGGDNEKINHIAEAAIEMNLTCNDLKKRSKFIRRRCSRYVTASYG